MLLVGGLVCGCGSAVEAPAPEAPAAEAAPNQPPAIFSVDIHPTDPTVEQTISLAVDVRDPERDELEIEVDWLRNGTLYHRGHDLVLPAAGLVRGDEIRAVVVARDATSEVSMESPGVTVHNRAPRMAALDLAPEKPTGADNLMAVARAVDPEEDEVRFEYRWFKNGEPIEGASEPALSSELVRRGDTVRVEVRPYDDDSSGSWTSSPLVTIRNAPPMIVSQPNYQIAQPGRYAYAVQAQDPDGDSPLRYELVEGPEGARLDVVSGELSWTVPGDAHGAYPIEVAVHDPHGASARQRYTIDLRWEDASAPAAAAPRPAADGEGERATPDDADPDDAPASPEQP
jgi:hypothetical protein